jgi:heme/copper-type cytochrome/quinol oxidase subunit 4
MTSLRALLRTKVTVIWSLLVVATLTSFVLGTDHAVSSREVASVGILLVAFVKVRWVGLYFMELRTAPIPLRVLFECYCVAVCGLLVGLYLSA